MILYTGALDRVRNTFSGAEILTQRKVVMMFNWDIILIALMVTLTIASSFISHERLFQFLPFTGTIISGAVFSLFFLTKGRYGLSVTAFMLFAAIVVGAGMAGKYYLAPHSGFALAYFCQGVIVFGALFGNAFLVVGVTLYFIACQTVYFVMIKGMYDGLLLDSIKNSYLDSAAALIITMGISILIIKTFEQAILSMRADNSDKNEQVQRITCMVDSAGTIHCRLNSTIKFAGEAIKKLMGNHQSQSSSLEELSSIMEEIYESSLSTVEISRDQNNSMENLMNIISSLSESIDKMRNFGNRLEDAFKVFSQRAIEGENSTVELEATNRKLLENSNSIISIASIIDEFFDRINLLSLNASIEAARAGDSGRGFAVVADEIGKLADSSASELRQITELIDRNRADVKSASRIIEDIIEFLRFFIDNLNDMQQSTVEIRDEIENQKLLSQTMDLHGGDMTQKCSQIETAMNEQETGINEILKFIEDTNSLVEDSTVNAENLRKYSVEMIHISDELDKEFSDNAAVDLDN